MMVWLTTLFNNVRDKYKNMKKNVLFPPLALQYEVTKMVYLDINLFVKQTVCESVKWK